MSPSQVLGIRPDADERAIKKRYRELARVLHPDHGGDAREFMRLQAAYQTLLEAARQPPALNDSEQAAAPPPVRSEEREYTGRPEWMDAAAAQPSRPRAAQWNYSRKNLHAPAPRDTTFVLLAVSTVGSAAGVTIAAALKGAVPSISIAIGNLVVYLVLVLLVSGGVAAVGSGSDIKSFVSTYLWSVAGLTAILLVVVPLPFMKQGDERPQAPAVAPHKAAFKPSEAQRSL